MCKGSVVRGTVAVSSPDRRNTGLGEQRERAKVARDVPTPPRPCIPLPLTFDKVWQSSWGGKHGNLHGASMELEDPRPPPQQTQRKRKEKGSVSNKKKPGAKQL